MPSLIKAIFKNSLSLCLLALLCCPQLWGGEAKGIIKTSVLNVRSGPGRSYPPTFRLKKNDRVDILNFEGQWIQVSHEGKSGYVRNRPKYILLEKDGVITPIKAPPTQLKSSSESAEVTAEWLNVRTGPDTTYPSITLLKKGTHVDVLKHHQGWLHIGFENGTGFVRNREIYIRIKTAETDESGSSPKRGAPSAVNIPSPQRSHHPATEEVKKINKQIKKQEEIVKQYSEKEQSIINGLNEIEISLNRVFVTATGIRKKLFMIETRYTATEQQLKQLKSQMHDNEKYVAQRLVALYKLSNIGSLPTLASSDSMYEFFSRKTAMDRILSSDAEIFQTHRKNMDQLVKLKNDLKIQKADMLSLQAEYNEKIRIATRKKEQRANLLADIRDRKSLTMAAIDDLKKAQLDLEKKIKDRYEEDREDLSDRTSEASCIFVRGGMIPPVNGQVITWFGQGNETDYNFNTFFSGIDIKTERGEPIQAICGGIIIFSDWLKGYGNLIIIDHGHYYYTVYAHAEELFKSKGDTVQAGEVIATVGESGSVAEPKLYFEIRYHGEPVNPMDWLKQG